MVNEKIDVRKIVDNNNLTIITGGTQKEQTLCARNIGINISKDVETKVVVICRKDDEGKYIFIDDVEFIPDMSILESCIENTNYYIIIDGLCKTNKVFLEAVLYNYPNKVIVTNSKCDMSSFENSFTLNCKEIDVSIS